MAKKELPSIGGQSFEDLKQVNDHGAEYWSARGLQSLLGYSQWRRFEDAIKRAQTSCEQSGNDPAYHFAGAGKMIELGKGGQREVEDYQLSSFACYLIAQNGDPRKPEIAQAQKYFAIQTRQFAGRYRSKEKRRITMILCCPLSLEPFALSLSKGSPSTGSGRTVRNGHAQTGPYWIMTRTITLPLIAFHPHPA